MSRATDEMVFAALAQVGIPGTKGAWSKGTRPPQPWFSFRVESGGESYADSTRYAALPRYRVELHMREYDAALVEAFEDAIGDLAPYAYGEEYDEADAALVSTFDFTVC